ncbi:MAG: hypothetical protein ACK4WH_11105 [Phycisphaerales bacterium]
MSSTRLTVGSILALLSLTVVGCASQQREDVAWCKSVKPGVVTTVNHYCVVQDGDPVDPAMEPIVWKGQKIGLCCEGCRPEWNAMSDTQKDAAVARAIAKGRPK